MLLIHQRELRVRKLSLNLKIVIATLFPVLLFFYNTGIILTNDFRNYEEAKNSAEKIEIVSLISSLIHETQIERGKTALFLGGAINQEELNKQRFKANEKREIVSKNLSLDFRARLNIDPTYYDLIHDQIKKYDDLRLKIDKKEVDVKSAIGTYSEIISKLLSYINFMAQNSSFKEVSNYLYTLRMLEDGKEAGGKLRANMANIFSKSQPLSNEQLKIVLNLKSQVDSNINSTVLKISDKSSEKKSEFLNSPYWQQVNNDFLVLVSKSASGKYEVNSTTFFEIITKALNIYAEIVNIHKDDIVGELQKISKHSYENFQDRMIYTIAITLVMFVFIFYMIKISNESILIIKKYSTNILEESESVYKVSSNIFSISNIIKESANNQKSSVQSTAVSINEITAMIEQNSHSLNKAKDISTKTTDAASGGIQKIKQMLDSMSEISQSSENTSLEVKKNNDKLELISDLIKQIESKTNIINDIVFQTKLLAFNASVEAARAGEHGKGFAVVAQEVGSLATMSGKAATEIATIIKESVDKVEEMISTTMISMDKMAQENKEKIERGIFFANDCQKVFSVILENANSLDEIVTVINAASREQSQGITGINNFITELDLVIKKNSNIADDASVTSEELRDKAKYLSSNINSLISNINGDNIAS